MTMLAMSSQITDGTSMSESELAPALSDEELRLIDAYWRGPPTTCPSGRSICSTTRCCAKSCGPNT
jgi:hypothetical protein